MAGAMFEGYAEVELLAEGGLGRVYRATRLSTRGVVAIKELRDLDISTDAATLAGRELDVLLQLKGHPHVISVEEFIHGPGGPCIVMEFAPGGSLHERVRSGALPAPEVVLVAQHTLAALAAAHEIGIIHRDIKPHNLLIGSFGQVKVCDFGIAALVSGRGVTNPTEAITVAYASPEELDDGPITTAADVYSFSATLLHLATGNRPSFAGRSAPIRIDDVIAASSIETALHPALTVVIGGLHVDPEQRPSIVELEAVFDEAASSLGARRLQRLTPNPTAFASTVPAEAATVIRPLRGTSVASTDTTTVRPQVAAPVAAMMPILDVPTEDAFAFAEIAPPPAATSEGAAVGPQFHEQASQADDAQHRQPSRHQYRIPALVASVMAVLLAGGGAYAALGTGSTSGVEPATTLQTISSPTVGATSTVLDTTTTTTLPVVVIDTTTTSAAATTSTLATIAPRVTVHIAPPTTKKPVTKPPTKLSICATLKKLLEGNAPYDRRYDLNNNQRLDERDLRLACGDSDD